MSRLALFAAALPALAALLIGILGVAELVRGRIFPFLVHLATAAFISVVTYWMVQP